MTDLAEKSVQREAMIRARVIAREVADRFAPAIASRSESQIDLSQLESEDSVKMVVIVDPNLQIIAPQSKLNQILGGGREAAYAMAMAREFKDGREKGLGRLLGDTVATWIEPIKTTDPRQVKTQVTAMVLVSIDFSGNLLEAGGLGVAYGTGFVVAGILGVLIFFILMRLTMKPFEVLNDDLDQVLRGELSKVTHEFKIEELNSLWNNINSTVQRLPKGGGSNDFSGDEEMVNWDHEFAAIRALCEASQLGFIAVDPNLVVVAMNPQFEEVSGIRTEAIGQAVQQVARDQSLISLTKDIQERALSSPSRSATDDFEFSGVAYQVIGMAAGPANKQGLAMVFKKKD
jgi:PAS domain-containing protein